MIVLLMLPLILASSTTSVTVETRVSGDNARVSTSIYTSVNGNETYVESSESGTVRVEASESEEDVTITNDTPSVVPLHTLKISLSPTQAVASESSRSASVSSISFFLSLWDQIQKLIQFVLLTGK